MLHPAGLTCGDCPRCHRLTEGASLHGALVTSPVAAPSHLTFLLQGQGCLTHQAGENNYSAISPNSPNAEVAT